jgi:hypothetical protein
MKETENLLDTQDLEAITSFTVDKVLSLHLNGGNRIGGGGKSAERSEKTSVSLCWSANIPFGVICRSISTGIERRK